MSPRPRKEVTPDSYSARFALRLKELREKRKMTVDTEFRIIIPVTVKTGVENNLISPGKPVFGAIVTESLETGFFVWR